MPSVFNQAFAAAQDKLYATYGVDAKHRKPGGEWQDITLCVNGYDQTIEQYPEVWVASATVEIRSSEVAAPERGDEIELNSTTYHVAEVLHGDPLSWTLALTKQMVRI